MGWHVNTKVDHQSSYAALVRECRARHVRLFTDRGRLPYLWLPDTTHDDIERNKEMRDWLRQKGADFCFFYEAASDSLLYVLEDSKMAVLVKLIWGGE